MGKVLQVIIALVSIKILTEVLSTEEVGNYYLLLTILMFFNFTFLNPLGQYYGRYLIAWETSKNLLTATNTLILLRVFIIFVSLIFGYGIFEYFGYSKYYSLFDFLLFVFIALVAGTHGVLISVVNTLGDRIKFIKYLVMTLLLSLVLSLVFVYFFDKSAMSWLYGIAVAQLFFTVFVYKYLSKNNHFSLFKMKSILNKEYVKKVSYFIIPITLTLFLQWGQNISYRFIIELKYSIEVLAFIAVGLSISGAIFSAVEGLATQYFNPIYLKKITNAMEKKRAEAWNEVASMILPIYLLLMLFVMSLSPYLTKVLVAEKFHEAYIYVLLGAMIEFFRVSTNIVYLVSQSELKTNSTILPYTVGFVISIVTLYLVDFSNDLWLIPLVLTVAYMSIFLILFISMKKLLAITIDLISLAKALLIAVPFGVAYFLDTDYSMFITLLIVFVMGLYFLLGVYMLSLKKQKEMVS
ncbi:MAG: Membrane protein involved in the export of O-antigen and teichoic acid [uncultured Sulfurovum sp.]|uniref:Membrane protein involved in the export of O-antigen and teichoic acid n=1 Tax=uncultured Sulfurovum sp. TaxID=269237 RepID=A0A6S6TE32_9BACT|nr:MAG: Membrane protein involved in the export of O-antigen and teichoic acid [uncultured Sulfurovum sp.]